MTEEGRTVILLGTVHRLQGAEKRPGNTDDPMYLEFLRRVGPMMKLRVDSIFEEASQLGPTTAEKLAREWGVDYHDVDPHVDRRYVYGLSADTGDCLKAPFNSFLWTKDVAQLPREDFWIEKIRGESFDVGLMICGFLHTLSLAGKLRDIGFEVYAYCYVPYDKLCRKVHAEETLPHA